MNTRERFLAVMNFKPFDHLPILEWAVWWDMTIHRWHDEGMPAQLLDRYDINRYFGQDVYKQDWLGVCKPSCPAPPSHGAGIIQTERDYENLLPHLFPKTAVDKKRWEEWATEQHSGNVVLWFSLDGFFWFPRRLLGIEKHLFAFYEQPELIHRINTDLTEWMVLMIEDICSICTPDFMTFGEDMSYNHGPMISESLFDEFLLPYYQKVVPHLQKRNILPFVDSDGDVTLLAPWLEKAGIKGILPLERQAGVDLQVLRKSHSKMNFIGHFDKMTMNRGEDAMRQEFERLMPIAEQGGYLISCDHQTPPGVSLKDYRLYMKLFREYAEEIGRRSRSRVNDEIVLTNNKTK